MQNTKSKILIVEDDLLALRANEILLAGYGQIHSANNARMAKNLLSAHKFDIAFFDLKLQEKLDGINLIEEAEKQNIYSIVISGESSPQTMEKAFKAGCKDYLLKPIDKEKLLTVIERYSKDKERNQFSNLIKKSFITKSQEIMKELSIIQNLNLSDKPVLITGETGTGKRVVSQLIQKVLDKKNYFELNCSQYNDSLIKSELFGHMKGSFTGAHKNKVGILEQAHNGIVFLDEIHSLSQQSQKILLKAIEEKVFYPTGSSIPVKSNFRIIAASCENIQDLVNQGEFRQDLYARISTFNIHLSPLSERREDIMPLFKYFISKFNYQIVITDEAEKILKNYDWPRNTREIQDLVENWAVRGNRLIEADTIPLHIKHNLTTSNKLLNESHLEYVYEHGLKHFLAIYKRELIREVMKRNDNSLSNAAKILNVTPATLSQFLTKSRSLKL